MATVMLLPDTDNGSGHGCALSPESLGTFIDIPGGGFVFANDGVYPEEGPAQKVFVSSFRMQMHEVTNSQFAAFVEQTGYTTDAERNGGSAVFLESTTPGALLSWWRLDPEASWRTPGGDGSHLGGRSLLPVVHVTLNDARAYASWVGGRLPTEVEWEYAASLGLFDPNDPYSGMRDPEGKARANIWTGLFPAVDTGSDGFAGLAPVGCFEPARTGAYDMIGNVWEWTESRFAPGEPRYTIKGGSYLCSDNFCQRYRVAARQAFETDLGTAHVGFRVIKDIPSGGRSVN
jgi:formylglycine-generating enzyme required for sulfatase activity